MSLPNRLVRLAVASSLAFGVIGAPALAQDNATSQPDQQVETGTAEAENAAAAAPKAEGAGEWHESSSLIEGSKYPDDFAHYDYVNPDAPKGGTLNQIAIGSFDSFNPFIVRGTPAAGLATFGGGLLYDTLMDQSPDEPGTAHALIAEAVRYPADFSSVTYRLNPEARWHDGEPVTVEDVIWSFETLTELHPQWSAYYKNIVSAEQTGDGEVTFTFDQTGNRELPNIVGDLTILPKHWWQGTDASGNKRDITQPTSEVPLGSGPYRIKSYDIGQSITWERVADYWGLDNPTRVGRYNYGEIRYVYLRDTNAAWEAFKKGGLDDWRLENMSRRWAEGYDFPAVKDGRVIRKTIDSGQVQSMQAYVLNNRLEKFQDRRVRKALTLAYNFEEMNRTLFFGLYERMHSYFENSELAAKGLPDERELAYLEPLRGQIPDEVFTEEFALPAYNDPGAARNYLREALGLLKEAGYELRGTTLVNAQTGEPFTIEFLGNDPMDNRTLEPFARQLQRLGIQTEVRIVDTNQYIERMNGFEFEVVGLRYPGQSLSPGNEQRDFWSTTAADAPGSRNYSGIKNPAIDQLIDDIVYAPDRESLVAATRALDRVLLWEYYVVPQWYKSEDWLAYWDKLQMPEKGPAYNGIDPFSWWTKSAEAEKAAAN